MSLRVEFRVFLARYVDVKPLLAISCVAIIRSWQAPSAKSVDRAKGRRLVLDGPEDAQAAAVYTLLLRLTPRGTYTPKLCRALPPFLAPRLRNTTN